MVCGPQHIVRYGLPVYGKIGREAPRIGLPFDINSSALIWRNNMETHILHQPQMVQSTSSMPMNEGDKSVQAASKYMPFSANTFPNAENIRPPKTEARRVVEPATRTSVNIDLMKEFYDKQDKWLSLIQDLRLRAYFKQTDGKPSGGTVDITV